MKKALLLLAVFTQTACVSAYKLGHADRRGCPARSGIECIQGDWAAEKMRQNQGKYADWDQKYVSDDTAVIEIFDENGRRVMSGRAR